MLRLDPFLALRGAALATAAGVLLVASRGSAQPRIPCPDVARDASAADQALCWDARIRGNTDGCDAAHEPTCVAHLAAYCEDAALDDPVVASACFRALVRLGRHDAAAATVQYVRDESRAMVRCRSAYSGPVGFHVVTNPPGAEVVVDGERYGAAPVDVRLASPWWSHRIAVRFGHGRGRRLIEVPPERVEASFDRTSCDTRDLVVQGPSSVVAPPPTVSTEPRTQRLSVAGLVSTVSGGLAAIAGGVMLVLAEAWAQDLHDLAPGTAWDADRQAQLDRIDPTRIAGATALGIGALAVGAGVVLLLLDGDGADTADGTRARWERSRARAADALHLRWRF